MHLKITTAVGQDYRSVMRGFDRRLFEKLSPPFPPVRLLRFEGSATGDIVSLELNFILFRQRWTSLITEDKRTDQAFYFVDEGTELPFFLRTWKHSHTIQKDGTQARIVDDIHFTTPFLLLDYLMYPILWLQFMYRKPVYKRVFRREGVKN